MKTDGDILLDCIATTKTLDRHLAGLVYALNVRNIQLVHYRWDQAELSLTTLKPEQAGYVADRLATMLRTFGLKRYCLGLNGDRSQPDIFVNVDRLRATLREVAAQIGLLRQMQIDGGALESNARRNDVIGPQLSFTNQICANLQDAVQVNVSINEDARFTLVEILHTNRIAFQMRHNRAARAEQLVRAVLELANDPDIDDVATEVYLRVRELNSRGQVVTLTLSTWSDAIKKAVRRRHAKVGRSFLKALPASTLLALPNLVQDLVTNGLVFPRCIVGIGGIIFIAATVFIGVRNCFREWHRDDASEHPEFRDDSDE